MLAPFRYLGSKHRLVPWLLDHFPPHSTYVEPFGGSGAVLLNKAPAPVEIFNDLNGDVVNLYALLRRPRLAEHLARLLHLTPYAEAEHAVARERHRCTPLERARRFLLLSHANHSTAHNSHAFRLTTDPEYNYAQEWAALPARLAPVAERLRGVTITMRDFSELIPRYDLPGVFLYCDPPYTPAERTKGHGYRHELTAERHRELCGLLNHCKHAKWALSGYDNGIYERHLNYTDKYTTNNATAYHKNTVETLWTNYTVRNLFNLTDHD